MFDNEKLDGRLLFSRIISKLIAPMQVSETIEYAYENEYE